MNEPAKQEAYVYMNYEEMFDHSYERVKNTNVDGKNFFTVFYENFIKMSPEIEQHFQNVDMKKQIRMMEKSFYSLFIFYATQNANDYLEATAKRHGKAELDISLNLFDAWMDAIIETVKQFDTRYSNDIGLSWRIVLSPGMTYMKYRYSD